MLETLKRLDEESLRAIEEEMRVRKTREVFLLFPLGSQFDHLIRLMLAKIGVFCLAADPASITAEDVGRINPKGIILSGGPASVYLDPPPFDEEIFDLGIPTLGICLGFQLWAQHVGAKVVPSKKREFGVHNFVALEDGSPLFSKVKFEAKVLQSHGDKVIKHEKLILLASTANAPVAAAQCGHLYGVQFHPEVSDTECGEQIFKNFCQEICGAKDCNDIGAEAGRKIAELKERIGDEKVTLALSGGSDSSVCAYLLEKALEGKKGQVQAIYIKGIDRPDDEANVLKFFGNKEWLSLEIVDATDKFLKALQGKTAMKEKRLAMRGVYKGVLEEAAERFGSKAIVQGTLYTDICESGGGYDSGAKKAQIKLHHNVNLDFSLPEIMPLADCVKDTARNIGRAIGMPEELLVRHPFPGPGLVVRITGEITGEKLAIARKADEIYIEELHKWELYDKIWQAGIIVTDELHTCTKGDGATSGHILFYFAVSSVNGFTAQPVDLPFDFHMALQRRFGNEIREVGAVAYRFSSKPYSTIEVG